MPKGDGTGPMGMGPMSGWGAGFCAGLNIPGFANRGCGMGLGRGRRNNVYAAGMQGRQPWGAGVAATAATDRDVLQRQAELLQNRLDEINKRLSAV